MAQFIRMIQDWAPREHSETPTEHMNKMLAIGTPGSRLIYFNPLVSILSAVCIWTMVIICMVEKDDATDEIQDWQKWVTDIWNWLYMVSQNIWIVILFYVMYKYWNLKLGKDEDEPEFSDGSFFAMLFSCGVATGLWYYTAEAMWHYEGYNAPRWWNTVMFNDNTRAEHALMVTYFHWGLHGWIPYVVVGCLIAVLTYRRGFPMSMRWTLYPLIGEMCYGPVGDFIEILSILCTIFGVCTSLGLGAMQINKGLIRLDRDTYRGIDHEPNGAFSSWPFKDGIEFKPRVQVWIIVFITLCATGSLLCGLKRGIKWLANIAFGLSFFIVVSIVFLDEPWYIFNAVTSAFGYYLWYLPKISFHTDAWEELGTASMSIGAAPDNDGGAHNWMNGWTIFYWGWWISWAPFVGTFIARISKGRKMGPVIVAALVLPSLWSFCFLGIFGAAQIRLTNRAVSASNHCITEARAGNLKWLAGLPSDHTKITKTCAMFRDGTCNGCRFTYGATANTTLFGWTVPGNRVGNTGGTGSHWQPVTTDTIRLYMLGTEDVLFEHLAAYGYKGWSTFITMITLVTILLYFVTSSDSASYVVDILAANGQEEPPLCQKIFWAFTEGAAAAALLASADDKNPKAPLNAVKALPIVMGLPYTFHLFWCCQSLLIICKEEMKEISIVRKNFKNFLLFNLQPMSYASFLVPFVPLGLAASKAWGGSSILYFIAFGALWVFFIVILCLGAADEAFFNMSIAAYICFGLVAAGVRSSVRVYLGITGDMVSDALACVFWLPFAMGQLAGEDFNDVPQPVKEEEPPAPTNVGKAAEAPALDEI